MRIRGYHTTYAHDKILREGFRPGNYGVWGNGVYLALDEQTTAFYHSTPDEAVLYCEAEIQRPLCVAVLPNAPYDYGQLALDLLGVPAGHYRPYGESLTAAVLSHGYDSVIVQDLSADGEPNYGPGGNQICVFSPADVRVLRYHHHPEPDRPEPDRYREFYGAREYGEPATGKVTYAGADIF